MNTFSQDCEDSGFLCLFVFDFLPQLNWLSLWWEGPLLGKIFSPYGQYLQRQESDIQIISVPFFDCFFLSMFLRFSSPQKFSVVDIGPKYSDSIKSIQQC